jgi:LmbE family N-acetylglucosaminyl deacetylase
MKVLVVAAHPGDEVLGCGGTIAREIEKGYEVYLLLLSQGVASRFPNENKLNLEKNKLMNESKNALKILGIKESNIFFGDFPDNKFDSVPLLDIVKFIESLIEKIKPDIIYTHYKNDLNIDHRKTFEAVITAARPIENYSVKRILSFEVLSSTEWAFNSKKFAPNIYVNIEDTINKKIKALKRYKSEIREYPHPRSIDGIKILAKKRGLEVGMRYAEGFILVREVCD